jgi:hypothetical protein
MSLSSSSDDNDKYFPARSSLSTPQRDSSTPPTTTVTLPTAAESAPIPIPIPGRRGPEFLIPLSIKAITGSIPTASSVDTTATHRLQTPASTSVDLPPQRSPQALPRVLSNIAETGESILPQGQQPSPRPPMDAGASNEGTPLLSSGRREEEDGNRRGENACMQLLSSCCGMWQSSQSR